MSVVGVQEDLFDDWKGRRYLLADSYLNPSGGFLVLLTDASYWHANFDQLLSWCLVNGGQVQGMTVLFEDSLQLTAFALRWSS